MRINTEGLRNTVIPAIEKSASNLESAARSIKGINAPRDFSCASALNSAYSEIASIKRQVIGMIGIVKGKINGIISTENKVATKNKGILSGVKSFFTDGMAISQDAKKKNLKAQQDSAKIISKQIGKTGASFANQVVGLFKGIGKVGESLTDAALTAGTAQAEQQLRNNVYNPIYNKKGLTAIDKKDLAKVSSSMWKQTMATVANQHVESAFNKFYKNTNTGKWLDQNAYSPLKSKGIVTKFTEGIGEVTGIALSSAIRN